MASYSEIRSFFELFKVLDLLELNRGAALCYLNCLVENSGWYSLSGGFALEYNEVCTNFGVGARVSYQQLIIPAYVILYLQPQRIICQQ